MDTVEFLRRILPASGFYVIARLVGTGWRHQVCDTIEEVAAYALEFDSQGVPTYHACAAYRERTVEGVRDGKPIRQVRTHKNVRALRAFWMDLDCGEGKGFESQADAIERLVDFCTITSLPLPMIVSSGGGIHIYWTLTDEILPEIWKQTAQGLKLLAAHHKFPADPACTSDPARVLRTVGTFNRKVETAPKRVELIDGSNAEISYTGFADLVRNALAATGIKAPEVAVRKPESGTEEVNQTFQIQHDFPPCSGEKVATRCGQLAKIRDTRGNVPEPLWYAGIQLLCHSTEGDELIHRWSAGYDGYSAAETDKKIHQIRGQSLGPTLCTTFADRAPGGCDGCPFRGKISSPVQLGTAVASAPAPKILVQIEGGEAPVEVQLPAPPAPFTRGENGGIFTEVDGVTHKIYEYDLFPTEIAFDEQLGYETMRVRHSLPQEGWREFSVQSSLLARPVDFEMKLRDNHVQPLIRNQMAMYADAYLRKIRTESRLKRLFKTMGWKNDNTEFALGSKLYCEGEVIQAGFSHASRGFLENFTERGSFETWRELTTIFQTPAFAPAAFMLLLAFAAPLLRLGERPGFTVAALGESNAGKSTMAKFMASVYGHPKKTWISADATANARTERLGAYQSIPAYMDEITTIDPAAARELVYLVSTGKGRDSLTRNREQREGAEWDTIFVASSNDSLQSKLFLEKDNPEAESLRLFEFYFPYMLEFVGVHSIIHDVLNENYGTAGPRYIKRLVADRSRVRAMIGPAIQEAIEFFGMDPKERFWSQACALTLLGGRLAREWGVIDFDPEVIRPWLMGETRRMRSDLQTSMVGPIGVLGDFLNQFVGERLVVSSLNAGLGVVHQRPLKELSQRYEKDTHTLYISRKRIKDYLTQRHHNYNTVKNFLMKRGILLDADIRKTLGAGTDYEGGSVPCWKIKTDHPDMKELLEPGVDQKARVA